jgi:hypothetical protein
MRIGGTNILNLENFRDIDDSQASDVLCQAAREMYPGFA